MTDDGMYRRRKKVAKGGKTVAKREERMEESIPVYEPDDMDVDGQLISHNVWVAGHRTSIRLEAVMWRALHEIAVREAKTIHELITIVSTRRHPSASLTATIRAFLVAYLRGIVIQRSRDASEDADWTDRGEVYSKKVH